MTKRPYFNNLTFHRVIPNFMIQTGDGQTGDGSRRLRLYHQG